MSELDPETVREADQLIAWLRPRAEQENVQGTGLVTAAAACYVISREHLADLREGTPERQLAEGETAAFRVQLLLLAGWLFGHPAWAHLVPSRDDMQLMRITLGWGPYEEAIERARAQAETQEKNAVTKEPDTVDGMPHT